MAVQRPRKEGGVSILEGHDVDTGRPVAGRGALFGRTNGAKMLFGERNVRRAEDRKSTERYKLNGGNLVAFGDFELGLSANTQNPLNPTNFPFRRNANDDRWQHRRGSRPAEPGQLDFNYFDRNRKRFGGGGFVYRIGLGKLLHGLRGLRGDLRLGLGKRFGGGGFFKRLW